ncbi:hypothetical protein BDZ91DRAFT_768589 [Kalaharituber pfeilii]|nr:hypothetical protein BDZ91DRAFT_768589 [Kalaharituber pfeilii]
MSYNGPIHRLSWHRFPVGSHFCNFGSEMHLSPTLSKAPIDRSLLRSTPSPLRILGLRRGGLSCVLCKARIRWKGTGVPENGTGTAEWIGLEGVGAPTPGATSLSYLQTTLFSLATHWNTGKLTALRMTGMFIGKADGGSSVAGHYRLKRDESPITMMPPDALHELTGSTYLQPYRN